MAEVGVTFAGESLTIGTNVVAVEEGNCHLWAILPHSTPLHTQDNTHPHTHTQHTLPPSANPPQGTAVGSGWRSASAGRGRGWHSPPDAASRVAVGASWESERAHWDCRSWGRSLEAVSLRVQ